VTVFVASSYVDGQPFKEQSQVAPLLGPWHVHLFDAVLGTVHPRHASLEDGLKLHRVQMPPLPLRDVVVAGQGASALRALEAGPLGMLDDDPHPPPLDIELNRSHRPRRVQPQNLLIRLPIQHASPPEKRETLPHRPTEFPDGPKFLL